MHAECLTTVRCHNYAMDIETAPQMPGSASRALEITSHRAVWLVVWPAYRINADMGSRKAGSRKPAGIPYSVDASTTRRAGLPFPTRHEGYSSSNELQFACVSMHGFLLLAYLCVTHKRPRISQCALATTAE